MKNYTIIGGVNGVGKSSFTGVLKERSTDLGVIVDVDKITAELGGNALAGGKAALRKINECIEKGISFTQETTLSREEAIASLQKNVTTLNAQQIAEAVILGWDLRNAVSAEKQRAYDMGFAGQDIGDVLDSKLLSHLTEAQRIEAFNEGAKVAKEAVTSGEKALPKTASVAYRKGSVRFDGDAKAISSKFKMTQRSAYIILERIAQLFYTPVAHDLLTFE